MSESLKSVRVDYGEVPPTVRLALNEFTDLENRNDFLSLYGLLRPTIDIISGWDNIRRWTTKPGCLSKKGKNEIAPDEGHAGVDSLVVVVVQDSGWLYTTYAVYVKNCETVGFVSSQSASIRSGLLRRVSPVSYDIVKPYLQRMLYVLSDLHRYITALTPDYANHDRQQQQQQQQYPEKIVGDNSDLESAIVTACILTRIAECTGLGAS